VTPGRLVVGDRIEVHTRFNDTWSSGFEIAEVLPSGYRVRRTHDRTMLPELTGDDDVRAVRTASPWVGQRPVRP
jgi:hypothetical protein